MADYDVAIVGAGFAGAVAAREITSAGHSAVIVEARDRLGGRTFGIPVRGQTVEVGGHWVHWLQPHIWAEITRYGAEVVQTPGERAEKLVFLLSNGRRVAVGAQSPLMRMMRATFAHGLDRFCAESRDAFPRPYDATLMPRAHELDQIPVNDHLAGLRGMPKVLKEHVGGMALSLAGGLAGSTAQVLRLHAAAEYKASSLLDALSKYQLRDGTRALLDAILASGSAEVRLSSPVREISQDEGGVVLTTSSGDNISARLAVVTVPPTTLGSIAFTPGLTPDLERIASTASAAFGIKIHALLKQDLVPTMARGAANQPFNWVFSEEPAPGGGTWIIASNHRPDLVDVTDPKSVEAALRRYFPGVDLVEHATHVWKSDPYALGGADGANVGEMALWSRALQAPMGNVYLAGSASATAWKRFLDGAVESGLRVSRQVRDRLGAPRAAAV